MKIFLLFFSVLIVFSLFSNVGEELSILEVELSSLNQMLEASTEGQLSYEIGTQQVTFGNKSYDLKYIIYTLPNGKRIKVRIADITELNQFDKNQKKFTRLEVDAIVNAANERCLGGSGINGAIHKTINDVFGKDAFIEIGKNLPILKEAGFLKGFLGLERDQRCPTGGAKLVPGLNLAKFIVQAVGPEFSMEKRKSFLKELI